MISDAIDDIAFRQAVAVARQRRQQRHRNQMNWSDLLLNRLEKLNLAGTRQVPADLRALLDAFAEQVGLGSVKGTVQESVDSLMDLQQRMMVRSRGRLFDDVD